MVFCMIWYSQNEFESAKVWLNSVDRRLTAEAKDVRVNDGAWIR
jgi:hypothetical protein